MLVSLLEGRCPEPLPASKTASQTCASTAVFQLQFPTARQLRDACLFRGGDAPTASQNLEGEMSTSRSTLLRSASLAAVGTFPAASLLLHPHRAVAQHELRRVNHGCLSSYSLDEGAGAQLKQVRGNQGHVLGLLGQRAFAGVQVGGWGCKSDGGGM